MKRTLGADTSLDNLRKDAKRWLKALRAGDADARARLRASWPDAPAQPVLRDVQYALAREYGLPNWRAFADALAEAALAAATREQLVAEFLEHSCLHYGIRPVTRKWDQRYFDEPARWRYAARILERNPWIAGSSIHCACVAGDVATVERLLAARPALANERGGVQAWEPLLYVCYGRLPSAAAAANALAIARLLLDAGARIDPQLQGSECEFKVLTGVIGHGENAQPPHPHAVELAELLIERGADPYDPQACYDTSLSGDDLFWLDFLYARSAQRNETVKWTAKSSGWPQDGMLNYLIGNAVTRGAIARARWLLERGANANATHFYTKRRVHTEAVLRGETAIAGLLRAHGATVEELVGREAFQATCMRLDREAARELARAHPQFLKDPAALTLAARNGQFEVVGFLLDLGMSPDVADATNFRPLHAAASADAVDVARLLIERGAEIDPVERRFDGVPLGWALHGGAKRTTALLGALSRSPKALVRMGNLARLEELRAENPALARTADKRGSLFFYLPDDADTAADVAEWLLEHGADPAVRNHEGRNAMEHLVRRGLESVAELLRND